MKWQANINDVFGEGRKAFMPYVTAGYPNLVFFPDVLNAAAKAGADIIELGIPFSDPVADGPVIQEAGQKSIEAGTTAKAVFEALMAGEHTYRGAIAAMTYVNIVSAYGIKEFFSECIKCGISAVILPDVPFEELGHFRSIRNEVAGPDRLALISFITPNTSEERLSAIVEEAEGFIYLVSSLGITGERETFGDVVGRKIAEIKAIRDIPVCVGFGISRPEHVREMVAAGADGVIVGSAIVRRLKDAVNNGEEFINFMKSLKEGITGRGE